MRSTFIALMIAALAIGCGERVLSGGQSAAELAVSGYIQLDDVIFVAIVRSSAEGTPPVRVLTSHAVHVRDPSWTPPEGWTPDRIHDGTPGCNPFPPTDGKSSSLTAYEPCIALDYGVKVERIHARELAAYAAKHGATAIDLFTLRETFSEELRKLLPLDESRPAVPLPVADRRGPIFTRSVPQRFFLK